MEIGWKLMRSMQAEAGLLHSVFERCSAILRLETEIGAERDPIIRGPVRQTNLEGRV